MKDSENQPARGKWNTLKNGTAYAVVNLIQVMRFYGYKGRGGRGLGGEKAGIGGYSLAFD